MPDEAGDDGMAGGGGTGADLTDDREAPVAGAARGRCLAVVPAAGASRRMGRAKLLLPWDEGTADAGTVVGSLLTALAAGGCDEIALVLAPAGDDPRGRAAAELAELASGLRLPSCRLTLAENPTPEDGMLSTILAGLDALGGADALAADGASLLVTPADLPALAAETVRAVLTALAGGARLAVPVRGDRRGHPLGIAPGLLPEIPRLDLDRGLRQLVERHAEAVVEVPVDDPGAVRDVDTPADYDDLRPG